MAIAQWSALASSSQGQGFKSCYCHWHWRREWKVVVGVLLKKQLWENSIHIREYIDCSLAQPACLVLVE